MLEPNWLNFDPLFYNTCFYIEKTIPQMETKFPFSSKNEENSDFRISEKDLDLLLTEIGASGFENKDFYEKTALFMDAVKLYLQKNPFLPEKFLDRSYLTVNVYEGNKTFMKESMDVSSLKVVPVNIAENTDTSLESVIKSILLKSLLVSSGDYTDVMYNPSYADTFKGDAVFKTDSKDNVQLFRFINPFIPIKEDLVFVNNKKIEGSWVFDSNKADVVPEGNSVKTRRSKLKSTPATP